MNKVQTKRFAFLAILMSLFLAVTAFAFMSVRTKAAAAGEKELRFLTEFDHSCWTQAFRLDFPVSGQSLGGAPDSDAVFPGNQTEGYSQVRVERGEQTWNATHIRVDVNDFDLYFLNYGSQAAYDKSTAVANEDKLIVEQGFTFTTGAGTFVCSVTRTWTYNGTKWVGDFEEIPEEKEDLSKYADMTVSMATTGRKGEVPFYVITDSASQTVDDNNVAALLQYVSMSFPDGTPANVWFCRVDSEQARFFVRAKNDASANINYPSEIPVGSLFTVKRGFRLDEISALKEDITFIFKANEWKKLVPATAITVENEDNLSLNNGATLQLRVALTPADSSDDIVYTALDSGVSVNASGLVTGNAAGTSQIKITAGSIEKTVTVTVKTPPTIQSISVNGTLAIDQYARITELSGSESAIGALTGVYHYSDDTTDTFPITKDMIGGWENVNTDAAADYTVKVTKDSYHADLTVTVKPSTVLSLSGSGYDPSWHSMYIAFSGSQAEYQYNNPSAPPADKAVVMGNMSPYVTANLKNHTSGTLELEMQMNYSGEAGKRTVNLYWHVGGAAVAFSRGDTVTLAKGFPALATATVSERIDKAVTFVYDGAQWVQLVEPTSLSISNKEPKLFVNVPHTLQIATDPAGATGILSFESSHPEYATVNEKGVITPLKLTDGTVAKVIVTVRYQDLTDTIEFTIENEPVKTGIVIEDKFLYYVPLNSTFAAQGYELYYHFVYDDGKISGSYTVNAAEIGESDFDFTQEGDRPLTITVEGFTDTVTVHVYELKTLVKWQDLGVDGYGDDRNKDGQFNGNMLITARNYSSSAANITGQVVDIGVTELGKMFDYVTYTTVDGTEYTRANDKLGGWLLGSTILINVNGKGFTGEPENGYMLGDKIKFAKGMPLYGWSGELDTTINPNDVSTPKAGTGCMYVIGVLENDLVYYCYDQNDTYSMWTPYVEYTDFTVRDNLSITVEGVGSLGAAFTPADSTTGYFTYVSSDPSVVTVNDSGNLVGVKEGTATITVTAHPIEASGYVKELPAKTVSVTVKKGITKVSGAFTVKKGAAFEAGNYKITVEYTDGTIEEIALDDSRVLAEEVDTSVVGESAYVVMVTVDGTSKRGTFTVNVTKKGCGSYLTGGSIMTFGAGIAFALAAIVVRARKKQS